MDSVTTISPWAQVCTATHYALRVSWAGAKLAKQRNTPSKCADGQIRARRMLQHFCRKNHIEAGIWHKSGCNIAYRVNLTVLVFGSSIGAKILCLEFAMRKQRLILARTGSGVQYSLTRANRFSDFSDKTAPVVVVEVENGVDHKRVAS